MKHAPVAVALALAGALVAGCGGGDSVPGDPVPGDLVPGGSIPQEDYSALEQRLAAAEQAMREAEEAAREANRQADDREAAVEQQIEREQAAREEADERIDDLEEELGGTVDEFVRATAREVFTGLEPYLEITVTTNQTTGEHIFTRGTEAGDADPTVTPRYDESASVSTSPEVAFQEVTGDTNGDWFRTSFSSRTADFTERLDVYTNAEAPKSVPFASVYNRSAGEKVVPLYNPTYDPADPPDFPVNVIDHGKVAGSILLAGDFTNDNMNNPTPGDRDDATAELFPKLGEPAKDFDQIDQGAGRNMQLYPLQYNAEVEGELGGAEGMFTCASAAETDCRVTNQNNHFRFVGPWVFTPDNADVKARVDDGEFMYFGWWTRRKNADGYWSFRAFLGPTETMWNGGVLYVGRHLHPLTGRVTYRGPAAGYYAIYQPLPQQSEYGEFSATATIIADFEDKEFRGTAWGTIDQFDNHPDWTFSLKRTPIKGNGAAPAWISLYDDDSVYWSIDGEEFVSDSGNWEAAFYTNLPPDQRPGNHPPDDEHHVPTGMAGTFEAEYHNVGRIFGAFGAHRVDD